MTVSSGPAGDRPRGEAPADGFAGSGARGYDAAVRMLDGLQSNAASIEQWKLDRLTNKDIDIVGSMARALEVLGVPADGLAVVHVAGTKGKGSVCAQIESLARRGFGLRTGLYTSPNLVDVRERIRVDGRSISRADFARVFFACWDRLAAEHARDPAFEIPTYFRFLTLMALMHFVEQKVHVAVLEVGIGGRTDATNVVHSPDVTAVTQLDMDHEEVLGDTLRSIAYEKTGIFKPGAVALAVAQGDPLIDAYIEERARLLGAASFARVPSLLESAAADAGAEGVAVLRQYLPTPTPAQYQNAALAWRSCAEWLRRRAGAHPEAAARFADSLDDALPPPAALDALRATSWPGRTQHLRVSPLLDVYVDGAHTPISSAVAGEWFVSVAPGGALRVLVFDCKRNRRPRELLGALIGSGARFDLAIFVSSSVGAYGTPESLSWQQANAGLYSELAAAAGAVCSTAVLPNAVSALAHVAAKSDELGGRPAAVLFTGSLYLAGAALEHLVRVGVVDPEELEQM